MPYDDADPEDPQVLVGVSLEGTEDTVREMVAAVADEFAQLGHSREEILALFRSPFYAGAHGAYTRLGETATREIVEESLGVWGKLRWTVQDVSDPPGHEEDPGINATLKVRSGNRRASTERID